jgi:hypothetical protein
MFRLIVEKNKGKTQRRAQRGTKCHAALHKTAGTAPNATQPPLGMLSFVIQCI